MQKIILFVEPNDDAFMTPEKIGNIYMNRFVIEEDDSSEILKILELGKTSFEISNPERKKYFKFGKERKQKGMDYFVIELTKDLIDSMM